MEKINLNNNSLSIRKFIHFLISCNFEDDLSKLRSYIYYVYHNIKSVPNRSPLNELFFENLYENSEILFAEKANIEFLKIAFSEIKNNEFKIEIWENNIFNTKKLIFQRKANPEITNLFFTFKKNITINGVINLLNNIKDLDHIDIEHLKTEMKLITKNKQEIYKKFIMLLEKKKLKPNSKIKHKKQRKSKVPYFPPYKEKIDFKLKTKTKIYSGIFKPNIFNSENEEDILHRK